MATDIPPKKPSPAWDAIMKPLEVLSKMAAICVPLLLFYFGNKINNQRAQESDNQQRLNRILALIKSLSSDNERERQLAINFAQYLANSNQYPPEMYGFMSTIISTDSTLSTSAAAVLDTLRMRANQSNSPVVKSEVAVAIRSIVPRIYIQYPKDRMSKSAADSVMSLLQGKGYTAPATEGIVYGGTLGANELRYFHQAEEKKVEEVLAALAQMGIRARPAYVRGHESDASVKPYTFELWFSNAQ